jgi:hypothetical protein
LTSPAEPPILPPATPDRERAVSNVPEELAYTPEHEYVARTGDPAVVRVGITDTPRASSATSSSSISCRASA